MPREKTIDNTPVGADDLQELNWLELAVLAFGYGRASAGTGFTLDELLELSDAEDPKKEIYDVLKDLEADGLLAAPGIFRLPSTTVVRPLVPGGSPHLVRSKIKGPPTWSTREKIWGLWISQALPEDFIQEMHTIQERIHNAAHSGDLEAKVAALADRVGALENWLIIAPGNPVRSELERQKTILTNEQTNLIAYRRKREKRAQPTTS